MIFKPSIILIRPQLAENIGMTARAMMNCGLYELRLVSPREDHLSAKAISVAEGKVTMPFLTLQANAS